MHGASRPGILHTEFVHGAPGQPVPSANRSSADLWPVRVAAMPRKMPLSVWARAVLERVDPKGPWEGRKEGRKGEPSGRRLASHLEADPHTIRGIQLAFLIGHEPSGVPVRRFGPEPAVPPGCGRSALR
jgi:hypothetical protein